MANTTSRGKVQFGHFVGSVFILIISTFGFFVVDLGWAKEDYIIEHNIQPTFHPVQKGVFFDSEGYYSKPEVSYDEIGDSFQSVLWHTVFFLVLYPLFGRFLVFIGQGLTALFNELAKGLNFVSDNKPMEFKDWDPTLVIYGTVLAPVTLISIPILLTANLLLFVYKYLS
jgi:hypothetical protein